MNTHRVSHTESESCIASYMQVNNIVSQCILQNFCIAIITFTTWDYIFNCNNQEAMVLAKSLQAGHTTCTLGIHEMLVYLIIGYSIQSTCHKSVI